MARDDAGDVVGPTGVRLAATSGLAIALSAVAVLAIALATEALMTYALYWVHVPLASALAAVVIYRGFNFLIVTAPGIVSYRGLLKRIRELGTDDRAPSV